MIYCTISICRFWQPDPKAHDYRWLSPYAYCGGDPINFIDPTGQVLTTVCNGITYIWSFNSEYGWGFYDQDGKIIRESDTFDEGTIESTIENTAFDKYGSPIDFTALVIRGDEEGQNIFEFLADNITGKNGIEYGHVKAGKEGRLGYNIVSTSHSVASEAGIGRLFETQLKFGYTLREINHSHPTGATAGNSDIRFKIEITSKMSKYSHPIFKIYHVPSKTYIDYTNAKINKL